MKILFIGYSSVVRRRILPFLEDIPVIDSIDIAKYHLQEEEVRTSLNIPVRVFNSYEEAIEKSDASLAYVSTVNHAHDTWAYRALAKGMHVIVDKPAFSDLETTEELIELSNTRNLGLAEAVVYYYHSQYEKVAEVIRENNFVPVNLTINFAFPEMDHENFRYRKSLGGGAMNDLGPYVVSCGRWFFNEQALKMECVVNSYSSIHETDNVENSFSVLMNYPDGRSLIGNFGFNSEYINRILVTGSDFLFEINRAFTPPADLKNEIIFKTKNQTRIIETSLSNSFINFLKRYTQTIINKDTSSFKKILLQDAIAFDQLKKNITNTK